MAFGAILGAVIGGGISLFGANQAQSAQQRAAKEQNKIAQEQAEVQFKRAQQEYEIGWQQTLTNYYWEQALTEQIRKNEALAAVDQASYGSRLIWTAAQDYMINSSALYDTYVVGEQLRFTQETLGFQNQIGELQSRGALLQNQSSQLSNESAMLGFRSQMVDLETKQAVARYMIQVAENGARADLVVAQTENKVDEMISALAAEEMASNFRYEIEVISGALESATRANAAVTRSGGGKVAKQGALNAVKAALRNYAAVDLSRNARAAKVGQLNSYVNNEQAKQIAILATQSEGYEQQAGMAEQMGALQQQGIKIQQQGLQIQQQGLGIQMAEINRQIGFTTDVFNQLTLPSFQLAQNQYARELTGLQVQTINQFQNALLPYRQREVFDPLGPIKGLAPEFYAPTKVYEPGGLSFGQGVTSFLSGANQFAPSLFNTQIPNMLNNLF